MLIDNDILIPFEYLVEKEWPVPLLPTLVKKKCVTEWIADLYYRNSKYENDFFDRQYECTLGTQMLNIYKDLVNKKSAFVNDCNLYSAD